MNYVRIRAESISLKQFINACFQNSSGTRLGKFVPCYRDSDCTVEARGPSKRSFYAILKTARLYYPSTTETQLAEALVAAPNIRASWASEVQKFVFYRSIDTYDIRNYESDPKIPNLNTIEPIDGFTPWDLVNLLPKKVEPKVGIWFKNPDTTGGIKELLLSGFDKTNHSYKFKPTYSDPAFKQSQCHAARRSFLDLFLICKTYFPETTKKELAQVMFDMKLNVLFCTSVRKYVWNDSNRTSTYNYNELNGIYSTETYDPSTESYTPVDGFTYQEFIDLLKKETKRKKK